MAASDHLGVQFYEGNVHPGQVQPRQRGMVESKVDSLTARMRATGYEGIPHIETHSVDGEIRGQDGHHRRAAAIRANLSSVPVYGMVHRGGLPDGTHEVSGARYDELWDSQ